MNTRRNFIRNLAGIGLFAILPGAGRLWRAERQVCVPVSCDFTFCHLDGSPVSTPLQEVMQQVYLMQRERILAEIVEDVRCRTGMLPARMFVSPL